MTALILALTLAPAPPPGAPPSGHVISTGQVVTPGEHLAAERPTVFVFFKPSSSLERAFVLELRRGVGESVGLREICLRTGAEPVARQHQVALTPTVLIYDRRGRLTGRSSDGEEIKDLVARAAAVMRIDWAEAGDPRLAEMERILGRAANSGIMRTLSLRPDWLRHIYELHSIAHRPNTALDRRTKEMIATYVSALNKCRF